MDKFPVTTRAVIQRINRELKPRMRRLFACRRNSRWWRDLGDYYVADIYRNTIVDTRVDPEAYGRRLGVLRPVRGGCRNMTITRRSRVDGAAILDDARAVQQMGIRNETELKKFVKSHEGATPDQLVRAINISLNLSVEADNAANNHRLNAAHMLRDLRRRVEAEGGDWWKWQEGKFARSRKDIEKLMRMANADDPEAAAELERTQTRERMRAHRAMERTVRSKPEVPAPMDDTIPPADPEAGFIAAFAALEAAVQNLKGDDLRRAISSIGELLSRLKLALTDHGIQRSVQSAADRAEARAQGKLH